MEIGRSTKEVESGVFVKETIKIIDETIELIITSKDVEVVYHNKVINRFGYSGEIKKSILSNLAAVIVDIGAIDKVKDARSWLVANDVFDRLVILKQELDGKIKHLNQDFNIKDSLMVFNEDFISMTEKFWILQPFYYDTSKIWWLWNFNVKCWEMVDEVDLFNRIRANASQFLHITDTNTFTQIKRSLEMVGRQKRPKDAPKKWIQFKDKAFSLESGKIYNVTKDYFFTNPIPWELGASEDTPTLDKLFEEWVGKKYVKTLYEIVAYCCYSDYPIQVLFCLYGSGRNGKSCFLRILSKFIGSLNLCSTDLDLLVGRNKSRFEIFKLYKKLTCLLGETNFGILESSAILKKLTGNDLIGFEIKGKLPFDDYNYAKILIASNNLPSSDDNSEGFYRRWVIIDFLNQFKEGKDIVKTVPENEYNNLALKVTKILPELLEKGEFTNQGTIQDRKNKYIMASNPLPFFVDCLCYQDSNGFIRYSEFYTFYCKFLDVNKRRIVSKKEFSKFLSSEGLEHRRTSKLGDIDYYIEGIRWKDKALLLPDLPDFKELLLQSSRINRDTDFQQSGKSGKNDDQKTIPVDIDIISVAKLCYGKGQEKDLANENDVVKMLKDQMPEDEVFNEIDRLYKIGELAKPRIGFIKVVE